MSLRRMLIQIPESLPTDVSKLHEIILSQQSQIQMLASSVEHLQRLMFGQSSERFAPGLEGQPEMFEENKPVVADQVQASKSEKSVEADRSKKKGHGRRRLPANLARKREEHDVSPEDKICSCGCEKKRIGEEITEQLEYVPASMYVIEHVCPTYACPQCRGEVVQATKPMQPVEKGMFGPGLLAHIVVSKYCDHLPLHRQEAIFARHGVEMNRSTLCDAAMAIADLVEPLYRLMTKEIRESYVIHSDDTPVPVQAKRKTHRAFLWTYVGDKSHPYVAYDFTWTRNRAGPKNFLGNYKGYLQADAYAGYHGVYESGDVVESGCWAHARRYFIDSRDSDSSRGEEGLRCIGELYEIERRGKLLEDGARQALRQKESRPKVEALFAWMEGELSKVLPKSPIRQAFEYALGNRAALERYLEDGALAIDNNAAERALRSIVVGRKNWLFAGSERGGHAAAIIYSLIESAKRHDINVFAYLCDVIARIASHPQSRLSELLPDNWKPLQESAPCDSAEAA